MQWGNRVCDARVLGQVLAEALVPLVRGCYTGTLRANDADLRGRFMALLVMVLRMVCCCQVDGGWWVARCC